MERVPRFQTSAEAAFQVVAKMDKIVAKYAEGEHGSQCSSVPDRRSVRDSDTTLATVGPRVSHRSSRGSSARRDRVYADHDNWSSVAVAGEGQAERKVRFASNDPQIIRNHSVDKEKGRPADDVHMERRRRNRTQSQRRGRSSRAKQDFTVFISHCGRDKHTMAIPLHDKLEAGGITSFVDKQSLVVGENAHDSMDRAMESAPIGVFIVSPEAAARKWPMKEMECFLERLENAKRKGERRPILIPVFYRMDVNQCTGEGLFDIETSSRRTVFRKEGFYARVEAGEASMRTVRQSLKQLSRITGIENDEGASNSKTRQAQESRERLLARIQNAVLDAIDRL